MDEINLDKPKEKECKELYKSEKLIVLEIPDSCRFKTKEYWLDKKVCKLFFIRKYSGREEDLYMDNEDDPNEDNEDDDWEDAEDPDNKGEEKHYYFRKSIGGILPIFPVDQKRKEAVYLYIAPRFPLRGEEGSALFRWLKENLQTQTWDVISAMKDNNDPLLRCIPTEELERSDIRESRGKEGHLKEVDQVLEIYHCILAKGDVIRSHAVRTIETQATKKPMACAINMASLFELYARDIVKAIVNDKAFNGWRMKGKEEGSYNLLPKTKLYISGKLIPDIVLQNKDQYIILDAKYKNPEVTDPRDDRLQLLAYADVYDAHLIGHIFPECKYKSAEINTRHRKKDRKQYWYVQFSAEDALNNPAELTAKLREVMKV